MQRFGDMLNTLFLVSSYALKALSQALTGMSFLLRLSVHFSESVIGRLFQLHTRKLYLVHLKNCPKNKLLHRYHSQY